MYLTMHRHISNVLSPLQSTKKWERHMVVVQRDKLLRMRKKLFERYTRALSLISKTQLYVTGETNFAWIAAPLEKLSEAKHVQSVTNTNFCIQFNLDSFPLHLQFKNLSYKCSNESRILADPQKKIPSLIKSNLETALWWLILTSYN